MSQLPRFFCRLSMAVVLLMSFTIYAEGADQYPELPRLHQITERLYRGAQPRPGGIRRLAELGINTVINLRGTNEQTRADEVEARSLGLNYFNIPLPIWGRPNDSHVQRILEIINAPESGRVFIHCRDGVDRTGMIIALHRISSESWSREMALAEAERSGMRSHQYWMRDYIRDFYVWQQRAATHQKVNKSEFDDKIGVGVRVGEHAVFRAKKTALRLLGDVF